MTESKHFAILRVAPVTSVEVPLPYSGLPPSHLVVPTLQSLPLPNLPSLCPPSSVPSFLLPSIPFPPLPSFSSTCRSRTPIAPDFPLESPIPFPRPPLTSLASRLVSSLLPLPLPSRRVPEFSLPSVPFSSLPNFFYTPLPLPPPLLSPLSPHTEPPFFPSLHNLLPSFPSLTEPPFFPFFSFPLFPIFSSPSLTLSPSLFASPPLSLCWPLRSRSLLRCSLSAPLP
ncbi:unnamed protein product [Closterium sp. Naga37s-1]|nr:unnamed protein product [Closterium sp. Naga37s-1]